jgi:hypothetical protein
MKTEIGKEKFIFQNSAFILSFLDCIDTCRMGVVHAA